MSKIPFPVSLDEELATWIKENCEEHGFRNRSHLVERAVQGLKAQIKLTEKERF